MAESSAQPYAPNTSHMAQLFICGRMCASDGASLPSTYWKNAGSARCPAQMAELT